MGKPERAREREAKESIEAAMIRDQLFLTFASDIVGDAKGRAINNP
jgi:hypothetical protein